MDKEYYIKRNEETARLIYGDKINANRKVEGTSIWFDVFWRIHTKWNACFFKKEGNYDEMEIIIEVIDTAIMNIEALKSDIE